MSPNFFLFFIEISVFLGCFSHFDAYFLSRTFLAASTMWAASIP